MIKFWAKTTPQNEPGVSVYEHMLNVGNVARILAEMTPHLLKLFHLEAKEVGALAALHDLGKISPGFQRKCEKWLIEHDLVKIAKNNVWDTAMESDHGKVSHAAIQKFLLDSGMVRSTAKYISTVLGGHHGRLNPPNDRGYRPQGMMDEKNSGIDWDKARSDIANKIVSNFNIDLSRIDIDESNPALWWLAGITSVADWIGSDERYFPAEGGISKNESEKNSHLALTEIGFATLKIINNLNFHELFGDKTEPNDIFIPNDMQLKVFDIIKNPGIYIIEAPMGMGKTEAALWATYNLLQTGKTNGIYFALPTQATSNRMYLRLNDFLKRISPDASGSRLIHSNSWLTNNELALHPVQTEKTCFNSFDARNGRDWFASTKRALIAPFGVGTIDQALLGIVAAKHFYVRHFALAGKVVILDEVHSYDIYTGALINELINTLEGLGCTIIILSATLTGKRRDQIILRGNKMRDKIDNAYPLITGRSADSKIECIPAKPPITKNIRIKFVELNEAMDDAALLAKNGGAILWICDTIEAAQKQYQQFINLGQKDFTVGLLHSRFTYQRREQLESEWMKRFDKFGINRCGSILVSTQIVEQSVDLDADLIITELAPTDMLLQRIGRLWRHEREMRPIDKAQCYIIKEKKSLLEYKKSESKTIINSLGSKGFIYAPYVLLRSLEVWKKYDGKNIQIPMQIREMIEKTYIERENEPSAWIELYNDWFGSDSAKKMLALRNCNIWQISLNDEEGVQTRLNDIPSIQLVLCRVINENEIIFIDESKIQIRENQYKLASVQAIHKNLVKIPEYLFEQIEPNPNFLSYLDGSQTAAVVTENGAVNVKGLKEGVSLSYTDNVGLYFKINKKRGENERCI
ncbi:MAG: CRISPR-associated helicase Cas3' [Spirochaetales bacterium]|nr:CRISPR-associated helicase Cas3' [Spirochaetales bacterium]